MTKPYDSAVNGGTKQMNTLYRCKFEFEREIRHVRSDRLSDFSLGFWINPDFQFTKGSDCRYWIPPSRILHVKKESEKESDRGSV